MITRIMGDIKTAMLNKDNERKNTLKLVLNKANELAKLEKIEKPTDEMVMDAIKKNKKEFQGTKDMLEEKGQMDSTYYKEVVERLSILDEYLPKQLSQEELLVEVKAFIENNGIDVSNFGVAMKNIVPAFKNNADGKIIKEVVATIVNNR